MQIIKAIFKVSSENYNISLIVMFVVCIVFFIIVVSLWASIFSNDRNKEIKEILNDKPEICRDIQKQLIDIEQSASKLSSLIVQTEIAKSVVSGDEINNLETSVKKDHRIIIFTSKFILEGDSAFNEIIIQNFRKGVKYEYYVPNDQRGTLDQYWDRIKEWYKEFTSFICSKEEAEKLLGKSKKDEHISKWNPDYVSLINKFIAVETKKASQKKDDEIKQMKAKLKDMFAKQLKSYALDPNLFYATVAMYQQEGNNWKAIIKLPTQNPQENFIAFSLEYSNPSEKSNFVDNILHLVDGKDPLELSENIFQD